MKKITFVGFSVLLIICCKKEEYWSLGETWKGTQEYGYVNAIRNGEYWEASAIATQSDEYPAYGAINFLAYFESDSILAESFSFSHVPMKSGKFNVHNTLGRNGQWVDSLRGGYYLVYYDVFRAKYFPDSSKTNYIWIQEIDTIGGSIRGKFDVTFRIGKDHEDTNYPRQIHFADGVFDCRFR